MKNLSFNKENLILNKGSRYIIIDALYIMDIKKKIKDIQENDWKSYLKVSVFPDTNNPFGEYTSDKTTFETSRIKKVNQYENIASNSLVFCTDSGILIFILESLFWGFAFKFDYDKLVETTIGSINESYLNEITQGYGDLDIGLVLAPGINSGFEFEGSGTYTII